jgi:hypothetical protein
MNPNFRPFYFFLAAVLIAVIAFGLYVRELTDCSTSLIGPLECHKLYLAFGVLFAIVIMLIIGAGLYALVPAPTSGEAPGKSIFDGFIKVLPPIATLVLGYYFGSTQTTAKSVEQRSSQTSGTQQAASAPVSAPSAPAKK